MKKFHSLIFLLSLCLLLSSCATVEDLPSDMVIAPDAANTTDPSSDVKNEASNSEFRSLINSREMLLSSSGGDFYGAFLNNLLFTNKGKIVNLETSEVFSACSDPLCDHKKDACADKVLFACESMVVSQNAAQGNTVLYLARKDLTALEDMTATINHRLLRYNFTNGEVSILAENLPGPDIDIIFDPKTDNIFFSQQLINDEGAREHYLYVVNGITEKMYVFQTDAKLYIQYAIGDVVYCWDDQNDIAYGIDFSGKEPVLAEAEFLVAEAYGGYQYYHKNTSVERVYVPDDMISICEKKGQPTYKEYTKYDLYRRRAFEENAELELVAENIVYSTMNDNYVCYYEFAPVYITSVLTASYYDERGMKQYGSYFADDPDAPEKGVLRNQFSEYYVPIHVLDAETLQEVAVIDSEQYWIDASDFKLVGDGVFVKWQGRAPEEYLTQNSAVVRIKGSGYLYFDQPYLTDEDMIVFDLPNTRT